MVQSNSTNSAKICKRILKCDPRMERTKELFRAKEKEISRDVLNKTPLKPTTNSISNISLKNLHNESLGHKNLTNELERIQKDEIYRFCEVDKFEDEMSDVLFKFNEKVEEDLRSSFCSSYADIRRQMCYFDSFGIFYIRSNLTELMEGLVIYGCDKSYNITILYVNSLFIAKFYEICHFVVQKLRKVLFPKKIQVRILNFSLGKRKVVSKEVSKTFHDMGFAISSIYYDKERNNKYSIFEMKEKEDNLEKCKLRVPKPRLNFKSQIILSNHVRLCENVSKSRKKSSVDYRALIFFSFMSFFKENYRAHRAKLKSLNCFESLLNHYEENIDSAKELKVSLSLQRSPD